MLGSAVGEIEMIAEPKHKPHHDDNYCGERRRQEKALDEALKNTFPASDPVSVEQPMLTAVDGKRKRPIEKTRDADQQQSIVMSEVRARQGVTGHHVRYVLAFGLASTIIALTVLYLFYFAVE